jgi:hypothetical protein
MSGPQATFERRIHSALEASPSRIPVILGGCGSGRTSLLQRLRDRAGRGAAQYIDIERCATTPERFLQAVTASSPFARHDADRMPTSARDAFDALLAFFDTARAPGGEPCTFLLDEVLELRTFESFPGLRHVLRDLIEAMAASPNRFVLSTRYVSRAHRLLRDATARFEVMHMPQLSASDTVDLLAPAFNGYEQMATDDRDSLGRTVQALTDGRAAYTRAIGDAMIQIGGVQIGGVQMNGGALGGRLPAPGLHVADPISALTALMSPDGALNSWCRFCYELRLHRARGYGALKAILDILADEEPLTLTEISLRLHRTPGSTKDYLSWLEDVDLVTSRQKRYSFTDPLLRLWVRLHCRPVPPTADEVVREVQAYALARLPQSEPAPALAYAGVDATPEERKSWGIIEID